MISNGKWILAVTVVSITAAAALSSARATCAVQDGQAVPANRATDAGMLLAGDAGAFAAADSGKLMTGDAGSPLASDSGMLMAGDAGAPLTSDSGMLMVGDAGAPSLAGDGGR